MKKIYVHISSHFHKIRKKNVNEQRSKDQVIGQTALKKKKRRLGFCMILDEENV